MHLKYIGGNYLKHLPLYWKYGPIKNPALIHESLVTVLVRVLARAIDLGHSYLGLSQCERRSKMNYQQFIDKETGGN